VCYGSLQSEDVYNEVISVVVFPCFARSGQCKVSIFNMNWLSNRAKFGVTSVIKRLTV
jgi:hypothetical protein